MPPAPSQPKIPSSVLANLSAMVLAVLGFVAATFYFRAHHASLWIELAPAVVFCGIVIVLAAGRLRHTAPANISPAARRYSRRLLIALAFYCAAFFAALAASDHSVGALAYAFAVAPALPLLAAIAIMGFYLHEENDEFQRLMFIESALWATGLLLAIATTWGFLETFHLAPHVESWVAFPLWAALNVPSRAIVRWRYQ
ncbi:MAG TPA: hypothetical protein VL971_00620 [Rhizomicrobium sp.]|nr:hypothetical protein [Rhizomicrobium sp.]